MKPTYVTHANGVWINVWLDHQLVGYIRPVYQGCWQYQPKGSNRRSEVFKTIAQVKQSLETES